jgi:DNA-binding MarR family transcriptional regulator
MVGVSEHKGMQEVRIKLRLLESVERNGAQTQRDLASELGVALGLVNAHIKRCVKKGILKAGEGPKRRYGYYLTSLGCTEKTRLTVEYLAHSLSFYRRARSEYSAAINSASSRGLSKIALAGASDLAEIAAICALEIGTEIVAVVDPFSNKPKFVGIPVFASFRAVAQSFDAVVITALQNSGDMFQEASRRYGPERVFVPPLLGLSEQSEVSHGAQLDFGRGMI